MSTSLIATIEEKIDVRVKHTNSDSSYIDSYRSGSGKLPAITQHYADGTTANKAQKCYHKKHTIAAAGSVTIDLNAAVDDNATYDFANIKEVIVRVRTPVTGVKAVVGGAGAAGVNAWAPWLSDQTKTEDVFSFMRKSNPVDGWAVPGAGTTLLKIVASGGNIDVDVSLIGH